MNLERIRKALRARYGTRKYRIRANGEIQAYGLLPLERRKKGWRLVGWLHDPESLELLGL